MTPDDLADAVRRLLAAVRSPSPDNATVRDRCDAVRRLLTNEAGGATPETGRNARRSELLERIHHPGWFWFVSSPALAAELLTACLPSGVPWDGDEWDRLQPLPKRLLKYMHGRDRADLADVCEHVWETGSLNVSDSALHGAKNAANQFLADRRWGASLIKVRGEDVFAWA